MKQYKYSKLSFCVACVVCYLIVIVVMVGLNFMQGQPFEFDRPHFMASGMFCFAIIAGIGEYSHRAVVFEDNIIKFNSVRAKSFRVGLTARDYRIPYDDVWRISADKLPLIGIYRVNIYGKNLPAAIPINCCFSKHKKLFADFYNICKFKNPNIKFDDILVEFAESRNENA